MQKRTFEFENMIIEYNFEKLPTKEDLEDMCSIFYKRAMKEKEKVTVAAVTKNN